MSDLLPITSRVLGVFLVMVVGAVVRRAGWLTSQADRSLAQLTAGVLLPSLFFFRIVTSNQFNTLAETWLPPALGFGFTCLGFGVAAAAAWGLGPWIGLTTGPQKRAFALCAGICNYGYIPLPLAEWFYPDAVVTLMVHNVGVDLALWSVGVLILSGHWTEHWRRAVFSPPLLAVVAALSLRQSGLVESIPGPVLQVTEALGQCAIPMGLLLGGAIIMDYIGESQWLRHLRSVTAAVLIRQAVLPAMMLTVAATASFSAPVNQVLLLQAAMPAATFPVVMVRLYDQDTGTAMRTVLGTSCLGLIAIPAWLTLGRTFSEWFGL